MVAIVGWTPNYSPNFTAASYGTNWTPAWTPNIAA